jgi:hypothetical protein
MPDVSLLSLFPAGILEKLMMEIGTGDLMGIPISYEPIDMERLSHLVKDPQL